jgi:hypothetical protein
MGMPRRGIPYPVTRTWQNRVRSALEQGKMTPKQFAKKVGCAQSTMSDLLSENARHSTLVPKIHRVLGWEPPQLPEDVSAPVPIPTPDAVELSKMFDRLSDEHRQKLLDDAKTYLEWDEKRRR